MAGLMYTVPIPAERDIDIVEQSGNATFKAATNCTLPNGRACENGSMTIHDFSQDWTGTSADIIYLAFPVIVVWGIASGILSIIVIGRSVQASHDSFLIGFIVSNIFILVTGGILKTQDYFGHHNLYQYFYGHLRSLNSWLWFTSLWILMVMVIERSMWSSQSRSKSVCSPCQAGVINVLIFGVSFISALPQFWEYEVTETFDYGTNQTIAMSQLSEAASSPEYKIMYFWYRTTITVFIPYPTLIVMAVVLSKGMKKSEHHRKRLSVKHNTGNLLNRKITEEIHIFRLFIVLIITYILLTGPLTFLELLDNLLPTEQWGNDTLNKGLNEIFEFIFYFYFAFDFLLFVSYSDRFRYSLVRVCCCCCVTKKKKSNKARIYKPTSNGDGRMSCRPDNKYFIN